MVAKYGSSEVTWSLKIRVLLTLPAFVPLVLLFAGSMAVPSREREVVALGAMSIVMGVAAAGIVPFYLFSVWRPRPLWLKEQKAERLRMTQVNEAVAKQAGPHATSDSEPTHTSITRRRW